MKSRVIHQKGKYRIVEEYDIDTTLQDLAGDCFDPLANPGISPKVLAEQYEEFVESVNKKGIYMYTLEVWNPEIGKGWEHIDSCGGFIGQHDFESDHYIVEEFVDKIREITGDTKKTIKIPFA